MGRKLPEYDPEKNGPYAKSKRRVQIFKRIYQHMQHWMCFMETGDMDDIITTIDGEEVYYYDMLIGIDTLPPRQREAFELICLQGYTESAATSIMLPNSQWSTPVQQYADMALLRMVDAYDQKQAGTWDPKKAKKKRKPKAEKADVPMG